MPRTNKAQKLKRDSKSKLQKSAADFDISRLRTLPKSAADFDISRLRTLPKSVQQNVMEFDRRFWWNQKEHALKLRITNNKELYHLLAPCIKYKLAKYNRYKIYLYGSIRATSEIQNLYLNWYDGNTFISVNRPYVKLSYNNNAEINRYIRKKISNCKRSYCTRYYEIFDATHFYDYGIIMLPKIVATSYRDYVRLNSENGNTINIFVFYQSSFYNNSYYRY